MDGVLVIDKPQGLTSHDVVASARRVLREKRVGHTGTLDPLATGVLTLVCGRATRLARFLTASDKEYEATIRFGLTTDSYNITGGETSRSDAVPPLAALTTALDSLLGQHLQTPPSYSAKKVAGRRAYDLARRETPVLLAPVPVTLSSLELLEYREPTVRVRLTCSAGYYVRAFAHALGEQVGTGACLEALRRTRAGEFDIDSALGWASLQVDPATAARSLVPLERLLTTLPTATVSEEGRVRIAHGRLVEPPFLLDKAPDSPGDWVRVFSTDGVLVALATRGAIAGSLHPSVVLI